jgi:hypothetical protein
MLMFVPPGMIDVLKRALHAYAGGGAAKKTARKKKAKQKEGEARRRRSEPEGFVRPVHRIG